MQSPSAPQPANTPCKSCTLALQNTRNETCSPVSGMQPSELENAIENSKQNSIQTAAESNPEQQAEYASVLDTQQRLQRLNQHCFCISLQDGAMQQAVQDELAAPEIFNLIAERCPHMFSARPVFVSDAQNRRMAQVVQAIESVVALPAFRAHIFSNAPEIARHPVRGVKGVFFGYDFHLHEDQLGLIEVNTNAGGAMLNAILARAQHSCCTVMQQMIHGAAAVQAFETQMVAMFHQEWENSQACIEASQRRALKSIAIVDEAPEQQFLYPEFLLFQQLFERNGLTAVIADPADLEWRDGTLWHGTLAIDLVYNRLTDFMLENHTSAALRNAYLADAIVLTPHPQAHALYADKRNLAVWSDPVRLAELGVPVETSEILLASIPHTVQVTAEHAEDLWAARRQLFFKPNAGFGGRAAYRGDKLTKRVWQEILEGALKGAYIAQQIVTPGERVGGSPDQPEQLKFDLRNYTYAGQVQWIAARTYQGQTTNFRTPGGGFAPVYSLHDSSEDSLDDNLEDGRCLPESSR